MIERSHPRGLHRGVSLRRLGGRGRGRLGVLGVEELAQLVHFQLVFRDRNEAGDGAEERWSNFQVSPRYPESSNIVGRSICGGIFLTSFFLLFGIFLTSSRNRLENGVSECLRREVLGTAGCAVIGSLDLWSLLFETSQAERASVRVFCTHG